MQPTLQPAALQPDVSLLVVLLFAALNPAVIAVAWAMGRRCDQAAKLIVAGFAAALAGFALLWLAAYLRLPYAASAGRAASGIFAAQLVFGMGWAALAYRLRHRGS
jgi:hypothetical protein